ncbi:hypothetical protein GCM10010435_34820 [Winogradskya consettensis]|uniref:Uncharacterized protein n=1 Tax=Winogradskya consettensis TaxID=113560 RepID=A0A919SLS9_9ACTN|nr:hypothetical protein [Actinoplanes consettensis]GIM74405.1 hypothetical protein Aco04nite_40140 [Actinoplanes consettensis]
MRRTNGFATARSAGVAVTAAAAFALAACASGSASGTQPGGPAAASGTPEATQAASVPATSKPAVDTTKNNSDSSSGDDSGGGDSGGGDSGGGDGGGAGGILGGERQIVLRPVQTFESILHVDAKGHLALTDGETGSGLFVLLPGRDGKHQIRLAKADPSGEASCIGLKENTSGSATLDAAPCDSSKAGQLFDFEKLRKTDNGSPTYSIRTTKGYYIRALDETGVEAVATGPDTTFVLVDNGTAPAGPGD